MKPILDEIQDNLENAAELISCHLDLGNHNLRQAYDKVEKANRHIDEYKESLREEYDDDAF